MHEGHFQLRTHHGEEETHGLAIKESGLLGSVPGKVRRLMLCLRVKEHNGETRVCSEKHGRRGGSLETTWGSHPDFDSACLGGACSQICPRVDDVASPQWF